MIYKINTTEKTIIISEGSSEEIVKLLKRYKGYNVVSEQIHIQPITYPIYPIYTETQPYTPDPFGERWKITC